MLSRIRFLASIYLSAFKGLIAILLTVSNISSKGAIAANSRSFEKNKVVKTKMIQTKMVRTIFIIESMT